MVKCGIFVVRFQTMVKEDMEPASSPPFFDNNSVIIKAWDPNFDIRRDDIRIPHTWIQLKLDFKYWGEECINKIASLLEKLLWLDQATIKR